MRPCLALAAPLLLLAGCTVGPNFQRPAEPRSGYAMPEVNVGAQKLVSGGETRADWYTLFQSEALSSLVREALRANPDLQAARHNLLAAQYELRAVAGNALPQLELGGHAERTKVNGSFLYQPTGAIQETANQFDLGLALAYDLDVFGGIRRSIEAQGAQTAGVRDQALNVYITLIDRVVLAAFDYVATVEQIDVTHHLVDDLQAQYELTHTLEGAGKLPQSDTLQAKAQLESTRATLPALEKQREVYRNALLQLIGRTPDAADTLPPIKLRDFELPPQLPVSFPSQLVRQRPDVLAAEETLHQASAAIGVAEAARFPSVTLSGQYAQQSIKTSDLFTKPASIWMAGANLTAPIFEGGRLRAREQEARERFLAAAAQYRSTVIGAFSDVANALTALQHDDDGYYAHLNALAAAGANRDLARDEFGRGKVSELVVLTAEQQYQDAALSQVQADVLRFADVATLFHALGGGWWDASDPLALSLSR